MLRRVFLGTIVMLILTGLPWPFQPASNASAVDAELESRVVHIGTFYSGGKVSISGTVPAESEALVRVTGKTEELRLKRKGRALGIFWMNQDTVVFHEVPSVYLLFTSRGFTNMAQETEIGLQSLQSKIKIEPSSAHAEDNFQELLKLKESTGLYGVSCDAVSYGEALGGIKRFSAELRIPARMPPGDYRVEVFALNSGEVVGKAADHLTVDKVGVPQLLSFLAFKHGALYGVVATLVAVVAGLLMGFLFRGSKGAH